MAVQKQYDGHGITYADYSLLPDDGKRYEVLEGDLVVSPAPNARHQDVFGELFVLLRTHVNARRLGKVLSAPIDVILAPDTIVQPDILFIDRDRLDMIRENIYGPPDLCIEVLSPSTSSNDRNRKKDIYARYGVREYWIVDPYEESIMVFTLRERMYDAGILLSGDDALPAAVIAGFTIRVGDVFAV